jgi:hypothetical protein
VSGTQPTISPGIARHMSMPSGRSGVVMQS